MVIVRIALVLLGSGCFVLAGMHVSSIPSERAKARRLRSLEDAGTADEAVIVSLQPFSRDTRAEVVFELAMRGGGTYRERRYVPLTSEMTVGSAYPIVRHRQFPDRFEVGVKEDVSRSRLVYESMPGRLWRTAFITLAVGVALVLTGILI